MKLFLFAIIFLLITLCSPFGLKREMKSDEEFRNIPWPFTVCGEGDWSMETLTLDSTPKRNTNNNIEMVIN